MAIQNAVQRVHFANIPPTTTGTYRMCCGPNVDVIDRRAETTVISAIASGSQHSTMRAISHPRADFPNAEPRQRVEGSPKSAQTSQSSPAISSRPLNTSRPTHAAGTARPRGCSRRERQCSCDGIFPSFLDAGAVARRCREPARPHRVTAELRRIEPDAGNALLDDVIIRAAAKPVADALAVTRLHTDRH
jgi:hypothetical protein